MIYYSIHQQTQTSNSFYIFKRSNRLQCSTKALLSNLEFSDDFYGILYMTSLIKAIKILFANISGLELLNIENPNSKFGDFQCLYIFTSPK